MQNFDDFMIQLSIAAFVILGFGIILHPELVTQTPVNKFLFGIEYILAAIMLHTKLADEKKRKLEELEQVIINLPKAKGKFED